MESRLIDQQNKSSSLASIQFEKSYRTESALRKAVGKTKRSLPASPSKQKAVIAKLLHSFNQIDKEEVIDNTNATKQKTSKGLSPEIIKSIEQFYEREDISRVSPNVKDCKRFINEVTGEKEYRQVRHLMFKLSEVHALFVEEYFSGNFNASLHRS